MAITFVQAQISADANGSVGSVTVNITAGGTGNLICGMVTFANTATLSNVKDNNGVTYNIVDSVTDAIQGQSTSSFYLPNISGAPTSIIATFSVNTTFTRIEIQEWSGVATTTPLDGHIGVQTAGGAAPSSGNFTTTVNGDLIYGGCVDDQNGNVTLTAGAGYTIRNQGSGATVTNCMVDESQIQGTASASTVVTFAGTTDKCQVVAMAFKAATGAGPPAGVQNNDLVSQGLTWARKFPDSYDVRYKSWEKWKQQTPTVLPLNLRVQRDWPLPTPPAPRLNDYTWIEPGDNLPVPRILTQTLRTQSTAPNPQPITWYQSWIDTGLALPRPTPFIPNDVSILYTVTWYKSWEESGLSLTAVTQAPFSQDDWPLPRQIPQIDRSWLLNNTIYQPTPPSVISEFGWQLVSAPQQPLQIFTSSGLSLTSVVQNPFFQTDWPNPQQITWYRSWVEPANTQLPFPTPFFQNVNSPLPVIPQPIDQTWIQSKVIFFQEETFPFSQDDWPNPQRIVWYKDWSLNLLQNTLTPAFQAPFNQFDWPLPKTYQPIDQFWFNNLGLLPKPTPFFQNVNAPLPVIPQPIDQTWVQELVNFYQANTFPFSQKDYPNPLPIYWFKDYNQNLVIYLPVGIKPFNQSDWPLGKAPSPIDQFYYQALALNLPTPPPPPPSQDLGGRTWTKEQWTRQLMEYVKVRQPKLLTFSEMGKMGGRPRKHT